MCIIIEYWLTWILIDMFEQSMVIDKSGVSWQCDYRLVIDCQTSIDIKRLIDIDWRWLGATIDCDRLHLMGHSTVKKSCSSQLQTVTSWKQLFVGVSLGATSKKPYIFRPIWLLKAHAPCRQVNATKRRWKGKRSYKRSVKSEELFAEFFVERRYRQKPCTDVHNCQKARLIQWIANSCVTYLLGGSSLKLDEY